MIKLRAGLVPCRTSARASEPVPEVAAEAAAAPVERL